MTFFHCRAGYLLHELLQECLDEHVHFQKVGLIAICQNQDSIYVGRITGHIL